MLVKSYIIVKICLSILSNCKSIKHNFHFIVFQVFDRIKEVANAKIVEKIDATYLFDIDDEGKYFVDLKTGEGSVTKGDPPQVADVTITMNKENILKMFNRK